MCTMATSTLGSIPPCFYPTPGRRFGIVVVRFAAFIGHDNQLQGVFLLVSGAGLDDRFQIHLKFLARPEEKHSRCSMGAAR